MQKAGKHLAIVAMGMALFFAWAFGAFPNTDTSSVLQARFDGLHFALLRLATVGVIPAAVLPFFSKALAANAHRILLFAVGCLARLAGSYINLMALALSDPLVPSLVGTFMMGCGSSIAVIFWGVLLHEGDAESNERAFIATFILTGAIVALLGVLPRPLTTALLFVIPAMEFACYFAACRRHPSDIGESGRAFERPGKDFAMLLAQAGVAITLMGFIWEMFATSTQGFAYPKQLIFGAGLVASAVLIWLFAKYSPSVGFVAATRWALPIVAVGLLLCSLGSTVTMIAACLLLASGQGALETILRMQIVGLSQKKRYDPLRIVGWGYAAIMLGAFLGPSAIHVLGLNSGRIDNLLIIVILAALVVISSLLFPNVRPARDADLARQPRDVEERTKALADAYGLSPREQEVLGHLLEGRSHPYIRDALFISKSTVDTHVHHIYSKTGVKSKQELIDLSKRTG